MKNWIYIVLVVFKEPEINVDEKPVYDQYFCNYKYI